MRKRAKFNFMFTDSTAKHFYGSVASMGFYYCTHNTRLFLFFSFFLSSSFFFFLLCLFVVVCSTSEITFIFNIFFSLAALNSLSCSVFVSFTLEVWPSTVISFINVVFAHCFALYARWTRCAPHKSHANRQETHLQRYVFKFMAAYNRSMIRRLFVCDFNACYFFCSSSLYCTLSKKKKPSSSQALYRRLSSTVRRIELDSESPQTEFNLTMELYIIYCVIDEKPIQLFNDFQLFNWLITIPFNQILTHNFFYSNSDTFLR